MGSIGSFLQYLAAAFRWWFVIHPWEAGLRVRWGRHVTQLGPGVHLRVPLMHSVYVQSVRLRRANLGMQTLQTLTTADGKTVTLGAALGYSISDVLLLYQTLHHPEGTLSNIAQGAIAEYVTTHAAEQCTLALVEAAVSAALELGRFGLSGGQVNVTDFAFVRTYRLMTGSGANGYFGSLNTTVQTAAGPA